MASLPAKWARYYNEPGPKILLEALKHYGTLEHAGHGSNPNIMQWAQELGVSGWYTDDDIPWCGLFMGIIAKRAGYEPPRDFLAAKNWLNFGLTVPIHEPKLADIMVYSRPGGNHVALYMGENSHAYLNYGGNQSNAVGFAWIDKTRLIGVRRCPWKVGQPDNVRQIILTEDGQVSQNEG